MTEADLEAALAPYRERSNTEIARLLREYRNERGSPDHPSLRTMSASESLFGAGKRYRYAMACLAYQALTGSEDIEATARPAVWLELYHLYTLFLDDIMDEDARRRTHPSAWSANLRLYRRRDAARPAVAFRTRRHRYAVSMAILDALRIRSLAERAIEGSAHLDDGVRARLLELLTDTDLKLSDGQGLDVDFEALERLPEEEYERMSILKTAVLYVAAAGTGALLADAPPEAADALGEFALRFAIAFQDRDDLLGAGVVASRIGGSTKGDIAQGKRTRLFAIATAALPAARRRAFLAAYGKGSRTTARDVRIVREVFREYALEPALRRIEENVEGAVASLRSMDLAEPYASALEALARVQLVRKR